MNNYNQPYLEKYTGRASRHKCPKCGDPHSFAYYLDGNTGQPINKTADATMKADAVITIHPNNSLLIIP